MELSADCVQLLRGSSKQQAKGLSSKESSCRQKGIYQKPLYEAKFLLFTFLLLTPLEYIEDKKVWLYLQSHDAHRLVQHT